MGKELDRLVRLVTRLRSPKGCPWDREQTHESLIRYLKEEAKELVVALQRGRWEEIEDELGDLLLQVLLHAQIKDEERRFDIEDVARSQYLKLRRRHPHVFGGTRYSNAAEVLADWKTIKGKERLRRETDVRSREKGKALKRRRTR